MEDKPNFVINQRTFAFSESLSNLQDWNSYRFAVESDVYEFLKSLNAVFRRFASLVSSSRLGNLLLDAILRDHGSARIKIEYHI